MANCVSKGFSTKKVSKVIEKSPLRSRNINPLANFAPMTNDFVAVRPLVGSSLEILEAKERPRKREKVRTTTTTTTVVTTTVPGTIPNADFKEGFSD